MAGYNLGNDELPALANLARLQASLPANGTQPAAPRNLFSAGLSAGTDELQGLSYTAAQALGKLSGLGGVEAWGKQGAERNFAEAAKNGRADLEIAPWKDGGASVLPWLGYQTTKMLPQLAATFAAAPFVPEAVVPAWLARAGAMAPKIIGGGALRAGMGAAEKAAAIEAGQGFAKLAVASQITGAPTSLGSMYQEADQKPGGATVGDAAKALAMTPVYSALEMFEPANLRGLAKTGLDGKLLSRVSKAVLTGMGTEGLTEGNQTWMEQSFRPDLTPAEKMSNIVDAALTGAAVGGVLSGIGGVRKMKRENPSDISGEMLDQVTGEALGLPNYAAQKALPDYYTNVDQGEGNRDTLPNPNDPGQGNRLGLPDYSEDNAATMQRQKAATVREMPTEDLRAWATQIVEEHQQGRATDQSTADAALLHEELTRRQMQENAAAGAGPLFEDRAAAQAQQQARLAELMTGVRKDNQFLAKLAPADDMTLAQTVHDHLLQKDENGKNWSKSETLLAQRLGVADENGQLVAPQQVEEQAAAAAPQMGTQATQVDPNQDVLPLDTGLPERFFAKPAGNVTQDNTAPATGNPLADALAPLRQQMQQAPVTQEADTAYAQAQAAAEAAKDADYAKALAQRNSQAARVQNPIDGTMAAAAMSPQAMWMLQKPATIKSWAKLTPEAKQQWTDVIAQQVEGQDFGQLRREISFDNGPVIATDYDFTPMAGAAPAEGIRDMLNRGALGEVKLTPHQETLAAINRQVDATFPPDVNNRPEGASKAAALKQKIWSAMQVTEPSAQASAIEDVNIAFETAKSEPLIGETPTRDYAGEVALRGQPQFVEENTPVARFQGDQRKQIRELIESDIHEAYQAKEITGGERIALLRKLAAGDLEGVFSQLPAATRQRRVAKSAQVEDNAKNMKQAKPAQKRRTKGLPSPVAQAVQDDLIHEQLSEKDQATLAKHYGEPEYNDVARKKFTDDFVTAVNHGLAAVDKAIRRIIKNIQAGVMALAVVFNPTGLTIPSVLHTQAQQVVVSQQQAVVPQAARAEMSETAQRVYEVGAPIAAKSGKAFIIADKPNGTIHVFSAKGEYLASSEALYGKQEGDALTAERAALNDITKMTDEQRITPAGQFNLRAVADAHYKGGYVLQLVDPQTGKGLGVNADGNGAFVAVHSVFNGRTSEQRETRLDSQTAADNKISSGCINTSEKFFGGVITANKAALDGGLVFVLPDNIAATDDMFAPSVETRTVDGQQSNAPAPRTADVVGDVRRSVAAAEKPAAKTVPQSSTPTVTKSQAGDVPQATRAMWARRDTALANLRRELAKMGLSKVGLSISREIKEGANSVAGTFQSSALGQMITVAMQADAKMLFTLRHEVIHYLRHVELIDKDMWAVLSKAAADNKKWGDWVKAVPNYAKLSAEEQQEEVVAQMFGDWMSQRDAVLSSPVLRALNKIMQALRFIGRGFKAAKLDTPDKIFVAIARGKMSDKNVDTAKFSKPSIKSQATTAEANATARDFGQQAKTIFDAVDRTQTFTEKARKTLLGWSSLNHIVQRFGDKLPAVQKLYDAYNEKANTQARFSQMVTNAYHGWKQLPQDAQQLVSKLMSNTEFGIDPRKSWAEHTHLHAERNAGVLKQHVEQANKDYAKLVQQRQVGVYEAFRRVNEATHIAQMAVSLHNLVVSDPASKNIPYFKTDPTAKFRNDARVHEQPEDALKYWTGVLEAQRAAVTNYLAEKSGEAATATSAKRDSIHRHVSPLEKQLNTVKLSLEAMQQAPYFHLGRFGDYFVSFVMRRTDKKVVDPRAQDHVAKTLEAAGFTGAQLSRDSTQPNAYIRVETVEQQQKLRDILGKLQDQGWLERDPTSIRNGKRGDDTGLPAGLQESLDRYVAALRADTSLESKDRERMISLARDVWLDQLPDTAMAKVMVHRESRPGYSPDMVRSWAHRQQIGTASIAGLSSAAKVTEAFTEMRASINEAQTRKGTDANLMQDVFDEVSRRDSEQGRMPRNGFADNLRAANHAFFLGMSPSYMAVNMTQLGVLLWPELSKKHGFVKAAKAMAKVSPLAFKVMKATLAEGASLGASRAADAIITEGALNRAGISAKDAEFIMKVVSTGIIDIGSASREIGRVADGTIDSKTDTALRYAAAAGYYSETLTRLIAALSARDLHGDGEGLDAYVNKTVTESMLNYSTWNTARQTGKMGIAGQYTPVMFSFMTYQFQVIEKLYRELGNAFLGHAKTAAEKREARRFLGSHLTAVTVLAGSLGLPAAAVFARATEALVDMFDDDDEKYDVKAAWRNYLAATLGKDWGEIASHGVLRAAGIDVANRIGEQDMLPFTKLLTDKRKWEDAFPDYADSLLGSPISMLSSIVVGGRTIGEGNVLEGMKQMMPTAIKGPIEAFRMSDRGYVDKQGNVLPMSVGAGDILAQALGFATPEKAEYTEAKMTQTVRKASAIREAGNIRKSLAVAIEKGDAEATQKWMVEAQRFDAGNPAYGVLRSMNSVLTSRAKARALSSAGAVPIGTNMKDAGALGLTSFANY